MPQVTLEYTGNIDDGAIGFQKLFTELHQMLVDVAGIDIENCKSRATRLTTYRIGEGRSDSAFVHLGVAMLSGRSTEARRKLGERCLAVLKRHFARSPDELKLQITVEVRDMERATYLKAGADPSGVLLSSGNPVL